MKETTTYIAYIDGAFSLFLDLTALNPHLIPYYPFTATTPARLTIAQHAAATQQVAAMLPSAGGLRADKLEVSSSVLFISFITVLYYNMPPHISVYNVLYFFNALLESISIQALHLYT